MPRFAGLLATVAKRSRAEWPVVLAAWLLLLCATTLLAAGVEYGDAVTAGGLNRALASAAPADRTVRVDLGGAGGVDEALVSGVAATIRPALAPVGGEVALVATTDTLRTVGSADDAPTLLVSSHQGLDAHASLVAGRWAEAGRSPVEATVSQGAAATLALAPGSRVSLVSRLDPSRRFDVAIVGVWRPDPAAAYWAGKEVELTGSETSGTRTVQGPLDLPLSDLLGHVGSWDVGLEWRVVPAFGSVSSEGARVLRDGLSGIDDRLRAAYPDRSFLVRTVLPAILDDAERRALAVRGGVVLVTLQFAVVCGYASLLVAGLLAERRRVELALLRSRGATRWHVAGLAAAEAVLLAVPAVLVAPWLALGVVALMAAAGPLASVGALATPTVTPTAIALAAAAGGAAVLALTLAAAAAGASLAGVRARAARGLGRTLPQRLGLDAVLVILAALALWQLRTYGSSITGNATGGSLDPLLVAAPAIGLLAGGIAAARLVPRLGDLAERATTRRRDLVTGLVARAVARQPLRYTRTVLLLVLASALGVFAAAYGATWARSQADQAAYQSPLDVRASVSAYAAVPDAVAGSAYRSLPGVTTATPVDRADLTVGRAVQAGELVGIDVGGPAAPGVPRGLLDRLGAARPRTAAVPLPAGAKRVAVTVVARLTAPKAAPDAGPPVPVPDLDLEVVVVDRDGLHRIAGSRSVAADGSTDVEIPLGARVDGRDLGPDATAMLASIELTLRPVTPLAVSGTLEAAAVRWSPRPAGGDWRELMDPGRAGWSWSSVRGQEVQELSATAGTPGRLEVAPETRPLRLEPPDDAVTFRLWAPSATVPLPAIAGSALIAASGSQVGDVLAVTTDGFPLRLNLVGAVDRFAPVDPSEPFAIVDGPSLALARYASWGIVRDPTEWWLATGDDGAAAAAAVARPPFGSPGVVARAALQRSMTADPMAIAIIGALLLGALSTVLVATIGVLVDVAVTTRGRLGDLALLRALGLPRSAESALLATEQAFVIVVGLVAGVGLGVALGWVVLPSAPLTTTGAPAVPPPEIVVPVEALGAVALLAVLLFLVVAGVVARSAAAAAVAPLLREGER